MQPANAPVGSDPDVTAPVLEQRPRTEIGEPVPHLIIRNCARNSLPAPATHSFVGRNPHASVPSLQERANEVVDQSLLGRIMDEALTDLPVCSPAFGSNPQCALVVAEYVSDPDTRNPRKSIRSGVAIVHAEEVYRCDPQIARS